MSRFSLILGINPRKKTWKIREMKSILSRDLITFKCRLEGCIQNAGNLFVLAVDRKENHYVLNMDPLNLHFRNFT